MTFSARAQLQLQIWDARFGRIVWEGFTDLTLAQEMLRERPVETLLRASGQSVVEKIPPEAAAVGSGEVDAH